MESALFDEIQDQQEITGLIEEVQCPTLDESKVQSMTNLDTENKEHEFVEEEPLKEDLTFVIKKVETQ